MRYFDEYRWTTNNYVYNRVRIPYESPCGWCGLGSRCSNGYKHHWYRVAPEQPWTYERGGTCEFKIRKRKAKYPSWKMVSKNRKQWMNKPTWKNHYNELYPGDYEIKWKGNDRRQ